MGDNSLPRCSPVELADDSPMTQGFAIPSHQIQKPLPEAKMSTLDELEDAYADMEQGAAAPTRVKTGGRKAGTPNKVQRFELAKGCKIYGIEALSVLVDIMRGSPDETGNWMHAFSEILLAPPAVEILRVESAHAA